MNVAEFKTVLENMDRCKLDFAPLVVRRKTFPRQHTTKVLGYTCEVVSTDQDENGKFIIAAIPKKLIVKIIETLEEKDNE